MAAIVMSKLLITYISIVKDRELEQAIKNHETRMLEITQQLADFKHRALTAEVFLHSISFEIRTHVALAQARGDIL